MIKQMNKKIILLISLFVLIGLVVFVYFYFKNPQSIKGFEQLYEGRAQNIESAGGNLFFIDNKQTSIIRYDIASQQTTNVFTADNTISYFYPSPDASKIIISTTDESNNNYILNLEDNKDNKLSQCWGAIAWVDSTKILSNCISQSYEYDPNTINNIELYDVKSGLTTEIVDLEFEPPNKIIPVNTNTALIVTNNAGFGSNDIYMLDTPSRKLEQITKNGFIKDAILLNDVKFAYSTEDSSNFGIYISSIENSNDGTKVTTNTDLRKVAFTKSFLFEILTDKSEEYLAKKEISNPNSIISRINLKNYGKAIQIMSIGEDIYLSTEKGIYKFDLTAQ